MVRTGKIITHLLLCEGFEKAKNKKNFVVLLAQNVFALKRFDYQLRTKKSIDEGQFRVEENVAV